MKRRKFVLFFIMLLGCAKVYSNRYRNDYVYYEKTDSFYKLHIEMEKMADAKIACRAENSDLMIPESEYDRIQAHAMFKAYPDLGEYMWLGKDRIVHAAAEEHLVIDLESMQDEQDSIELCEVFTRRGQLLMFPCYHKLPFMCRVAAVDAPKQEFCDVYGTGYEYNATVDRCYKVSSRALPWSGAAAECAAENANLAVLHSDDQRDAVSAMLQRASQYSPDARASWFFLLGFRAISNGKSNTPRTFVTIFNETLEQAGFSEWSPNEPNNYGSEEDCGSLFRNDGRLNDVSCRHKYRYVCEKRPPRPAQP